MAHTGFKGLTQQIHNIFFIAQDVIEVSHKKMFSKSFVF